MTNDTSAVDDRLTVRLSLFELTPSAVAVAVFVTERLATSAPVIV